VGLSQSPRSASLNAHTRLTFFFFNQAVSKGTHFDFTPTRVACFAAAAVAACVLG
jgi:hypothetical protein